MDAVHSALASCASRIGATDSKSSEGSSRHTLPARVSFANLAELHDTLRKATSEAGLGKADDYVITDGKKLVYAARIHTNGAKDSKPVAGSSKSRKRRREDGGLR